MCTGASTKPCFLVEWYQPDLIATPFVEAVERLEQAALSGHSRVRSAMTAPTDETTFAVIEGDSAEAVTEVCRRAGWRTDRITPVTRAELSA
jgi:hypothetical protein